MTNEEIEKEFWEFERQNKNKVNTRKDAYLAGRLKGQEEIDLLKKEMRGFGVFMDDDGLERLRQLMEAK